jgi:hypothetical protein
MHNAPPVVYPVGRFVWGVGVLGVLALLGAVALLVWQTAALPDWPYMAAAWLLWSASLWAALLCWLQERSSSGQLVWSGEDWLWRDPSGAEMPVRVDVLLDAGRFMILAYVGFEGQRLKNHRAQFAVLHHASMPSSWHGFRCAVYSRPKDDPVSTQGQASRFEM